MKTVFVVNPVSGTGLGKGSFVRQIEEHARNRGVDVTIYETKGLGDAERYVHELVREAEEDLRIFVCGGDGTMNEAVNGLMMGKQEAEEEGRKNELSLGLVPIGSGNDFIKNFWSVDGARSIDNQLSAEPMDCDVLEYTQTIDGKDVTRYCANMFNIGFDCNVADLTNRLKQHPLINGSFAYLLGVLGTLIKKKGADLKVEVDGEVMHEGPLLLCSLANGPYCGGGIMSNPSANVSDGQMDVNVIKNISRVRFLQLFPHYSKGTHMQIPNIEKTIRTAVCREAVITPLQGKMKLCTDGEITDAGTLRIRVIPHAIRFLGPRQSKG